ncbi:16S rRNA (uracil(1498)-N(3))-methyltransferase [Halioxenophilus sp. WMMB6]|uniref:16S rRNA (uracil(1498)-N(3))-methyltransferase n=1 Tax=Halioxenophilus sp. WMMB6 TaxID=3073815 RepID=UPI00295E4A3E|nr:16S rRNA (uracil(1498)-N(3))-methyltransferase [Halioxenophilus sp. WMMB6]
MNLLILRREDFTADDTACVSDYRADHLRNIHRLEPGDTVRAGILNGEMGEAVVLSIDSTAATLRFQSQQPPPPALPLTLVLALPRPQMLKRSLQTVASLGVKEIYLIQSERVEKSFWSSPVLQEQQLTEHLLLGLEQGVDTILPTIHFRQRFRPFVTDELPKLIAGKQAWLAHPGDYPPCPERCLEPSVLVIGPEGGFVSHEVTAFTEAGCQPMQLGPRILRVEVAIPMLLSRFYPY